MSASAIPHLSAPRGCRCLTRLLRRAPTSAPAARKLANARRLAMACAHDSARARAAAGRTLKAPRWAHRPFSSLSRPGISSASLNRDNTGARFDGIHS